VSTIALLNGISPQWFAQTFLDINECTDQYCARYMTGTRGKGETDTGTNHTGFRCVMSRR